MDEPTRSEVESMDLIEQIAAAGGGKITERVNDLGDGSGYAIVSFPLRKDHWIYQKDDTPAGFKSNVPPMPFRMGSADVVYFGLDEGDVGSLIKTGQQRVPALKLDKRQFEKAVRAAGKYAVRCATMNGAEMDFDPDALLQNLVVGMLGYWTDTGLIGCAEDAPWCDPQAPFDFHVEPPVNYGLVQEQATGTAPQPPEE
jgi:hypothetical protein